jgi:hypothetical protein
MDVLTALGRTIPFAFASGLNLYATVAVLGLCARFELVEVPNQFRAFGHSAVIVVALLLYVIEFVADKIPWVDTMWDMVHTIVRPLGGAFVAVTALGATTPGMEALAGLVGASVAMTTHLTKAGTRAVANTSPEPVTNWTLSVLEDLAAVGLAYFAIQYPLVALAVTAALLVLILLFSAVIVRALRRRFARG